jgi:broad specificity phosphatase PhoE
MEQLFLIRHGETLHNVAGIAQGWNDSDLSDKGRRQVRALAERLAKHAPTAIFSSPLGRALSTAQVIADIAKLDVQTLDDLREMNYGDWEGQSFLDVRRNDLDLYHRWVADPDLPCPSGESHNDVLRRMQRAFAAIHSARPVVVTHGTAIRIGATHLLGASISTSRHLAQDNAALNVFFRRGDRWVLKLWNDTTHCAELS